MPKLSIIITSVKQKESPTESRFTALPFAPTYSLISFHSFAALRFQQHAALCWPVSEGWVMALLPVGLCLLCFSWVALERMKEMAFSEWEWLTLSGNTQWDTSQYSLCLHRTRVCGLQAECYQKCGAASKVQAVKGSNGLRVQFFSPRTIFRRWSITSPFTDRDYGLFTSMQKEEFRMENIC